ncbi:hypothetical protein BDW74DRAFT_22424 [Aspergillus multicolor]|uniref:uncharacterized protein n=1 Tax=Aspergillus multicolor TaxID=41759 RepID=UPI003CCDF922
MFPAVYPIKTIFLVILPAIFHLTLHLRRHLPFKLQLSFSLDISRPDAWNHESDLLHSSHC